MYSDPKTVSENDSLSEAIKIMKNSRVDSLLVVNDDNVLQGILDLEMIDQHRRKEVTIPDVMETDFLKVGANVLLRDTVHKILRQNIRYAPVVDETNHLLGIVTRASIVNIVYDSIWGDEETTETV